MNLILIGYRGSGKSTVARVLSLRLGWQWIDADVEIELQAGKSIAAIFADDGERAFRDLETRVVADLARRRGTVIALGGGAILREQNRAALAGNTIVWLRAKPDTIADRIAADPATAERRPKLTADGGRHEIESLLAVREPIYRQLAHQIVDTDGKPPEEIAGEIIARLEAEL